MPRVSDEHRAERRRQITAAALRCVLREGFHKTTMADIVAESGLSAGAVYGYFAAKTDIIRAVAELSVGAAMDDARQRLTSDPDLDLADAIDLLLTRLLTFADLPEGDLTAVALQAWGEAQRDPEIKAVIAPRMRQLRCLLRDVAVRQQELGRLSADADPGEVAKVMLSLLPGFVVQRHITGGMDRARYLAALRAVLSTGTAGSCA